MILTKNAIENSYFYYHKSGNDYGIWVPFIICTTDIPTLQNIMQASPDGVLKILSDNFENREDLVPYSIQVAISLLMAINNINMSFFNDGEEEGLFSNIEYVIHNEKYNFYTENKGTLKYGAGFLVIHTKDLDTVLENLSCDDECNIDDFSWLLLRETITGCTGNYIYILDWLKRGMKNIFENGINLNEDIIRSLDCNGIENIDEARKILDLYCDNKKINMKVFKKTFNYSNGYIESRIDFDFEDVFGSFSDLNKVIELLGDISTPVKPKQYSDKLSVAERIMLDVINEKEGV